MTVYRQEGVFASLGIRGDWVCASDMGKGIAVALKGYDVQLSPEEAKTFARQLHRLANAIIKRRLAKNKSSE